MAEPAPLIENEGEPFIAGLSLKAKFSAWLIVFILVVMAAVYAYFTTHERQVLSREIKLRGLALGQNLTSGAEEFLVLKDDLALAKLVYDTKKEHVGVVYCFVVDSTNRIWAHTDAALVNTLYQPAAGIALTAGDSVRTRAFRAPGGIDVFEIALPVRVGSVRIGAAYIAMSQQSIRAAVAEAGRGLALVTVIILGLGIAGVLFLISLIIGSLGELTMDIEAIGNGDLEREIVTGRRDEIGRIAYAVKTMAGKLRAARAVLVERERMKREMQIAREIQQTLLPATLPDFPGYALAAYYQAAIEVGGDYYDFVKIDERRFGAVVADVSGKGVAGSMVMAMARSLLKVAAPKNPSPRQLLTILNHTLTGDIPEGMFITFFYAVFDMKDGSVTYSSTGHNPAYLYDPVAERLERLKPGGPPLGLNVFTDAEFAAQLREDTRTITPGMQMILYTDGVTEAMDAQRRLFGEERLELLIRKNGRLNPEKFKEVLKWELGMFTGNEPQFDDITFVVVQKL